MNAIRSGMRQQEKLTRKTVRRELGASQGFKKVAAWVPLVICPHHYETRKKGKSVPDR